MKHRYEDIYDELREVVPELELGLWPPEEEPNWQREMDNAGQPLSEEDKAYLHSIEANNPQPKKIESPLIYIHFEDELRPLLISYCQQPKKFARLATIMDWLEELARDGDWDTSNLVAIAICEGFIGNDSACIPQLLPFMGATMRQMCRDLIPNFRVDEKIKALLASSN
ncbi:hypothetical protein EON83_18845 [bacterium]|nr:MAG: hypothetical protein EON83_18845 [bacterium]